MFETYRLHTDDGATIYARSYGHGDPLLMIHGAGVDADFFDRSAEVLAQRFRVLTYDRRGYGRSCGPPTADWSVAQQVADVATVLTTLAGTATGACPVVAHSAGCCIALALAARHPDLVGTLVLHEPAVLDCLPAGDSAFATIEEAMAGAGAGLVSLPVFQLLSLEQVADERAPQASADEVAHRDHNCKQFLSEAPEIYRFVPDYSALTRTKAVVGLGERSLATYHARNCPELARRLGGRLAYFPGGHNSPSDLPYEFACQVTGSIALPTQSRQELTT